MLLFLIALGFLLMFTWLTVLDFVIGVTNLCRAVSYTFNFIWPLLVFILVPLTLWLYWTIPVPTS